jgi:putative Mn2+ efflux pump MntP
MSPVSIGVLAFSMSIDAFIASVGKGAVGQRPSISRALKTGFIFGLIEAITPLIGWTIGVASSQFVKAVDHWIAFGLLAAVGFHMLFQAASRRDEAEVPPASNWAIVATAIGTSIDAMAVGVSLAFLDVNIFVIALAIGCATMLMSSTGVLAGRILGDRFGRIIEAIGGLALIGLGGTILVGHLAAG